LRARADFMGGQVFRFGTDEFVLVVSDVAGDEKASLSLVRSMARRACEDLGEPYSLDVGSFETTSCAGITLFDGRDFTASDVFKHADTALQDAKDHGSGSISAYTEQMDETVDRNYTLMNDLRAAIGTDALRLAYQPQAACKGGIVGAEGLLRWNHEERGNVSPGDFIPAAERSGLIVPLTRFVLEEAFRTLAKWKRNKSFAHLTLSVNISARQFENDSFVEEIAELVRNHDIDPSRLVLELTEHVLAIDLDQVKRIMSGLKAVGVRFSLDDFGTGYSSLDQLRQLPFDEVKIDGTFVSELEHRQGDRAIVRSIIAMADAMGMETVAEWVETEGQRAFLSREGCTTLQGYAFGGAVPLDVFHQQIEAQQSAATPEFAVA
ncbi:MAG: GGDEF domain-containing phosphodiesterase, partial [Pseudomonadota bacterium]